MNKFILLLPILFSLAGCGGGSESTSKPAGPSEQTPKPPAEPFAFTLSHTELNIGELSSASISIQANSDKASYTIESSDSNVSVLNNSGALTLSIAELQQDITAELKVVGVLGAIRIEQIAVLHLSNTSAQTLLSDAEQMLSHQQQITDFTQVTSLHRLLLEFLQISGEKTHSETAELAHSFNQQLAVIADDIKLELGQIANARDGYKGKSIEETELQRLYSSSLSNINRRASTVMTPINDQIKDLGSPVANITLSDFTFDQTLQRYSLFVGNPHLGEYVEAGWQFSSDFEYLEKALPHTYHITPCNQSNP